MILFEYTFASSRQPTTKDARNCVATLGLVVSSNTVNTDSVVIKISQTKQNNGTNHCFSASHPNRLIGPLHFFYLPSKNQLFSCEVLYSHSREKRTNFIRIIKYSIQACTYSHETKISREESKPIVRLLAGR